MTKKKAKKRIRASKELTRKQLSRLERERRIEKWLLWGVGALGILVVAVMIYGYVAEEVVKAREPVAVVDDAPITTAEFQARVRFVRMQIQLELQRLALEQSSLDMTAPGSEFYLEYIQGSIRDLEAQLSPANALVIGEQVLDQLVVGELVEQEAERRGIEVTAEELQQGIELYFGYDRDPATPAPAPTATPPLTPTDALAPVPTDIPVPTPTPMTEEAFSQLYDDVLGSWESAGISEQQYRSWMEASLQLKGLREQMDAEVPTIADQVTLRYMSVDSEEWANDFVARLDAGEDFQALVDELEEDEQVTGYNRELGWYPLSGLEQNLGAALAELAFSLEVGEHSQVSPDESGGGYYVIEVLGHEERDLDPYALQQAQEEAFQEWVEAQKQISLVEYPPVRTECWGDTSWYQEECRSSWRDRNPAVCRWALFWPCAGSWQDRVPMDQ
ncbi:MAG: SurA N-terminal domain-containing protein [Chloroflexi bacterium]|nr:SurA N-terminal domain-containing protein [Chloroflexota bacterium]